jgi:hypothetical protein
MYYILDRLCAEFLAIDPEVPGSIPGSTRFSASDRTMALGSTQPLTEMSTGNLKKETWG